MVAKNSYRSIQRFLLIVVVMSVALPATLTGLYLIRENFTRTVEQDSRIAATNYVELLQAGMTMPLWNIAADLGQPLIESVSIDPSIVSIHVRGGDDATFLSYEASSDLVGDLGLASLINLSRDIIYEGELLGRVDIAYSIEEARSRAENESRLLITILISQLVFTVALMSFSLRRRVINPLNQLEVAAAGIATGDLRTSIPSQKNDEFGALSKQLEKMRGSLESSFSTLEERVRERTADLVDVNVELKETLDQLQHAQGNLVQSEKLAALGSLVAGVSHELNTPIGNGLTVASSMQDSTSQAQKLMESGITRTALVDYLNDMEEGSSLAVASLERASELVAGFKQVAMDRTSEQRREFNLASVLREVTLTSSPAFKNTPYITEVICDEEIHLDSFPGPLGQIITNLLNNALIHAFDGATKGNIMIYGEFLDSENVQMRICDDGCGISPENITRIFDPFFTTKLGAGGNGLGMHIVHNIVSGMLGGVIKVESELGRGTTFIIDMPLKAPVRPSDYDELIDGEIDEGENHDD